MAAKRKAAGAPKPAQAVAKRRPSEKREDTYNEEGPFSDIWEIEREDEDGRTYTTSRQMLARKVRRVLVDIGIDPEIFERRWKELGGSRERGPSALQAWEREAFELFQKTRDINKVVAFLNENAAEQRTNRAGDLKPWDKGSAQAVVGKVFTRQVEEG